MELNRWFIERDSESVKNALISCTETYNSVLFVTIVTCANELLLNSKNEEDVVFAEEVLMKAIDVTKIDSDYRRYIWQFFASSNEKIRFYCYAKADYNFDSLYGKLHPQKDNRIIKLIELREFCKFLNTLKISFEDRDRRYIKRIDLFEKLLVSGMIECICCDRDGEFIHKKLCSILFDNGLDILINYDFDRYLSNECYFSMLLNDMYEKGILKFRDVEPFKGYFNEDCSVIESDKKQRQSLIRQKFGKDKFREVYKIENEENK